MARSAPHTLAPLAPLSPFNNDSLAENPDFPHSKTEPARRSSELSLEEQNSPVSTRPDTANLLPSTPEHSETPVLNLPGSVGGSVMQSRWKAGARRSLLNCNRISAILKNFKFFQDMEPTVQQSLPTIVEHIHYEMNTVLFRQGDPPGNCYAVLSGEVGIYVRSEEDDGCDSARGYGRLTSAASMSRCRPGTSESIINPTSRRRSRSLTALELEEDMATVLMRKPTAEGFSCYHEGSQFGKQVGFCGPGKLIGELALLNSQPRSATIKCVKDTEFLVISRRAFDQVLKDDIKRAESQKVDFLTEHVPGMRDLPPPKEKSNKPHASYFFKKATYTKDHEFLIQGTASDDTIFVVFSGAVEFRRYELTCPPSRCQSANRGYRMKVWTPKPSAPKGGKAMATGKDEHGGRSKDIVRKMGVLLVGGLFGSLPFPGPEPFSVVALSTPCEVLYCSGNDLTKLPRNLVSTIQEYIANCQTWRLASLRRSLAHDQEQERKKEMAVEGRFTPLSHKAKYLGLNLVQAGKLHPHPSLERERSTLYPPSQSRPATAMSTGMLPAVADAMPRSGTMSRSTSALPSGRPSSPNASRDSSYARQTSRNTGQDSLF